MAPSPVPHAGRGGNRLGPILAMAPVLILGTIVAYLLLRQRRIEAHLRAVAQQAKHVVRSSEDVALAVEAAVERAQRRGALHPALRAPYPSAPPRLPPPSRAPHPLAQPPQPHPLPCPTQRWPPHNSVVRAPAVPPGREPPLRATDGRAAVYHAQRTGPQIASAPPPHAAVPSSYAALATAHELPSAQSVRMPRVPIMIKQDAAGHDGQRHNAIPIPSEPTHKHTADLPPRSVGQSSLACTAPATEMSFSLPRPSESQASGPRKHPRVARCSYATQDGVARCGHPAQDGVARCSYPAQDVGSEICGHAEGGHTHLGPKQGPRAALWAEGMGMSVALPLLARPHTAHARLQWAAAPPTVPARGGCAARQTSPVATLDALVPLADTAFDVASAQLAASVRLADILSEVAVQAVLTPCQMVPIDLASAIRPRCRIEEEDVDVPHLATERVVKASMQSAISPHSTEDAPVCMQSAAKGAIAPTAADAALKAMPVESTVVIAPAAASAADAAPPSMSAESRGASVRAASSPLPVQLSLPSVASLPPIAVQTLSDESVSSSSAPSS